MFSRMTRSILATTAAIAIVAACAVSGAQAAAPGDTYSNPVSQSFADTYADPAIIQGKDGWWYAYATADPLRSGGPSVIGHISRTRDFSSWEYVGPIFTSANRPSWATRTAGLWAPDVRYINGKYVMYFTVTDTTLNPGNDNAIGVATADSPAGPWVPTDEPIVAPRGPKGDYYWTIDPAGFTDTDGNQYLYWGSYYGGVWVTRVSKDGLTTTGEPKQVGHWDRYEGSYVVEHDGWYYLMASSANCCAGPATGYSVFVGRSKSPMGPFLDREGRDMNASVTGGTILATQNGNRWIGAGHNAMMTDAQGRDFLVYHAIPKDNAWLNEPFGINRRPMLLDKIDWIDGWPVINAGFGPSDTPMPGPVTTSLVRATPWEPANGLHRAKAVPDPQGGVSARIDGRVSTEQIPAGDVRVRFDLKSEQPATVFLGEKNRQIKVWVDPMAGTLTASANGRTVTDVLPAAEGWRTVAVELDKGRLTAYVSSEDLADPSAIVRMDLGDFELPAAPLRINGNGLVDNLTVARPAVEDTVPSPQPKPGTVLLTQDFSKPLDSGWSWIRPDSSIRTSPQGLTWPLKGVDLTGTGGSGALLLRDAPSGDWIAETKFTLDLGSGTNNRNFQQAGLVVWRNDDDFARLGSVSIWGTRTVEYGRELAAASDGRLIYGGAIIGANASTMWMRIAHHRDAAGDLLYRAGISTDGVHWIWGATWTFPAGSTPRIGIYAGGGASPATNAVFHSFTLSEAQSAPGTWPR